VDHRQAWAHREGDYSRTPLVIKDSWKYLEREEDGELLRSSMRVERMLTSKLAGGDRVGGCVHRDGRGNWPLSDIFIRYCQDYELAEGQNGINIDGIALK
jgi:hypothetical protein